MALMHAHMCVMPKRSRAQAMHAQAIALPCGALRTRHPQPPPTAGASRGESAHHDEPSSLLLLLFLLSADAPSRTCVVPALAKSAMNSAKLTCPSWLMGPHKGNRQSLSQVRRAYAYPPLRGVHTHTQMARCAYTRRARTPIERKRAHTTTPHPPLSLFPRACAALPSHLVSAVSKMRSSTSLCTRPCEELQPRRQSTTSSSVASM